MANEEVIKDLTAAVDLLRAAFSLVMQASTTHPTGKEDFFEMRNSIVVAESAVLEEVARLKADDPDRPAPEPRVIRAQTGAEVLEELRRRIEERKE